MRLIGEAWFINKREGIGGGGGVVGRTWGSTYENTVLFFYVT